MQTETKNTQFVNAWSFKEKQHRGSWNKSMWQHLVADLQWTDFFGENYENIQVIIDAKNLLNES